MRPLCLFGIPITPVGYYMDCVLTNAQIELIASDVSVVDYGTMKKRKKGEHDSTPASRESVRKANEEWLARYGDGKDAGKGLSIGDIFKGGVSADIGVKVE